MHITNTPCGTSAAFIIAVIWLTPIPSAMAATGNTWHVPKDFSTISSAIANAANGDTILVAPGMYPEFLDFQGKAVTVESTDGPVATIINASGLGTSAVMFYSGESSTTVLRGFTITGGQGSSLLNSTRRGGGIFIYDSSPVIEYCIISGNTAELGGGIFVSGSSIDSLRSITVRNNAADAEGGGLYVTGNLTASDLVVTDNSAGFTPIAPMFVPRKGGGAAIFGNAVLSNCVFRNNQLSGSNHWSIVEGGGMYAGGTAELTQCWFELNTLAGGGANATVRGGGLYLHGQAILTEVVIRGNSITADRDVEGAGLASRSDLSLVRCSISENHVSGGWAVRRAAGLILLDPSRSGTLDGCVITGNTGAVLGGGMLSERAVSIRRSLLSENQADSAGGAIWSTNSVSLEECLVMHNIAGLAGGIWTSGGLSASTSRFVANAATTGSGGAVIMVGGVGELFHCLFIGNSAATAGGGVAIADQAALSVQSCQFEGNSAGSAVAIQSTIGGSLLISDTNLCETGAAVISGPWSNGGGVVIGSGCHAFSDCDGDGTPDASQIATNPDLDLDGDGLIDQCVIKLGFARDCNGNGVDDAFEYREGLLEDLNGSGIPDCCELGLPCGPAECPGDLNGDGRVDGADISVLLGFWGLNGRPVAADINGDGIVDGADLATMLGNWGQCD
jgi:hypothetical protein